MLPGDKVVDVPLQGCEVLLGRNVCGYPRICHNMLHMPKQCNPTAQAVQTAQPLTNPLETMERGLSRFHYPLTLLLYWDTGIQRYSRSTVVDRFTKIAQFIPTRDDLDAPEFAALFSRIN
jgi:hypothetical protein